MSPRPFPLKLEKSTSEKKEVNPVELTPCPSWWSRGELNPRPPECDSGALPTELLPPFFYDFTVGLSS